MDDDEKGKQFLKLIDDQNNYQWNIVAKLSALIDSKWNSVELKTELESLVEKHFKISDNSKKLQLCQLRMARILHSDKILEQVFFS